MSTATASAVVVNPDGKPSGPFAFKTVKPTTATFASLPEGGAAPDRHRVRNAQRLPDGAFTFRFHGDPGQTLVVERSHDLREWLPVTTNTVSELGYFGFTEPDDGLSLRGYFLVGLP